MPALAPVTEPDPSFVLLQVKPGVDAADIDAKLQSFVKNGDGSLLFPLGDRWYVVGRAPGKELRIVAGGSNDDLAQFIALQPGIAEIQVVHAPELIRLYEEHQSRRMSRPPDSAPIDNWNLDTVRAPQAWRFLGGWEDFDWKNVRIGHLDTGYTQHPVFGPWLDNRSPTLLPHLGSNFFDESEGPLDRLAKEGTPGHGTRTCSVLCGVDPAKNFLGVAPHVPVVPYRVSNFVVLDTLWWKNKRVGEAIKHAVFNAGCSVLSISMGDPCNASNLMGEAVDLAYEHGVIVVAAAGNITSEVTYPGRYSRAFGIGGITRREEPWNGGSRGITVDISAPAAGISRADCRLENGQFTPDYGNVGDGTSYATVHVSAAAAMWLAHHGDDLSRYHSQRWQIVEAFRSVLTSSARKPNPKWDENLFGAGILDIEALLKADLPKPEDLVKEPRLAELERF